MNNLINTTDNHLLLTLIYLHLSMQLKAVVNYVTKLASINNNKLTKMT
jgi:hypothetical protein